MLQKVREYSKRFYNKATESSGCFQKLLKSSRKFWNVPECSRRFQKVLKSSKNLWKNGPESSKKCLDGLDDAITDYDIVIAEI
jgi:hypothetical protein